MMQSTYKRLNPPYLTAADSWVDPDTEDDVPKKRFKSASAEDVSKLRAQNTEKAATDKQTKWAVKIFQGTFYVSIIGDIDWLCTISVLELRSLQLAKC